MLLVPYDFANNKPWEMILEEKIHSSFMANSTTNAPIPFLKLILWQ